MRISDWSSDVCSADLLLRLAGSLKLGVVRATGLTRVLQTNDRPTKLARALQELGRLIKSLYMLRFIDDETYRRRILVQRSEEHTSELQSLMRISYSVFCLKKKNTNKTQHIPH